MRVLSLILAAALLAVGPGLAQEQAKSHYTISFDPQRHVTRESKLVAGKNTLLVTVRFKISQVGETTANVHKAYKIRIKEEGKTVEEVGVPEPTISDDLSAVLAMDVSGSMKEFGRIDQARTAAESFFAHLPPRADCGLILFNHNPVLVRVPLSKERGPLRARVQNTLPSGGTAYLDATFEAIDLLRPAGSHSRAVVVMTDGVDLNSRFKLEQVIEEAKKAGVRVFTVGIGEKGKNDPVSTVLALDRSGSMLEPADDKDKVLKLDALKGAARRFVEIMRLKARASVVQFSDEVSPPGPFTGERPTLQKEIDGLTASGETAFLDAAYTALLALIAENPPGKRAVVVLTDGIDNSSRRRKEEIIDLARQARIPLHMLGLGREGELDEDTMKEIASKTQGIYRRAGNEKDLLQIFEDLSIKLHDDGIDEDSLKALAEQTGGKYYHVKEVDQLKLILGEVSRSVQEKEYVITFPSLRQVMDGTVRPVTLEMVYQGQVIEERRAEHSGRGVVTAVMNPLVYLGLLGVLGVLLALPPALRKLTRPAAGG